ncbi:uncharacterized protein LOC142907894 [Petromyzon marinus]|uniref:uncharacterized protein LOC142907894 n=1 Tax=Petromyzon marinus TaxID=7757 RepID=UPI003F70CB3E
MTRGGGTATPGDWRWVVTVVVLVGGVAVVPVVVLRLAVSLRHFAVSARAPGLPPCTVAVAELNVDGAQLQGHRQVAVVLHGACWALGEGPGGGPGGGALGGGARPHEWGRALSLEQAKVVLLESLSTSGLIQSQSLAVDLKAEGLQVEASEASLLCVHKGLEALRAAAGAAAVGGAAAEAAAGAASSEAAAAVGAASVGASGAVSSEAAAAAAAGAASSGAAAAAGAASEAAAAASSGQQQEGQQEGQQQQEEVGVGATGRWT